MKKVVILFIQVLFFSQGAMANSPEDLKVCLGDWKSFSKESFIRAQLNLVNAFLNKDISLLKKFSDENTKVRSDKSYNFLELNEKQLGLLLNDQTMRKAIKKDKQVLESGKYINCVGYRGLMLGNGEVWFSIQEDYKINIITFNSSIKNLSLSSPSFKCKDKLNFVEGLICENGKLSSLDKQLNSLYSQVKNEQIINQQRAWLKIRNTCKNETCVILEYKKRILQLLSIDTDDIKSHSSLKVSDYYQLINEYLLPHSFEKLLVNKVIPSYEDNDDCRICKKQYFLSTKKIVNFSETATKFIRYFFENLKIFSQRSQDHGYLKEFIEAFMLVDYEWEVIKNPHYLEGKGAKKNNEYAEYIFKRNDIEERGIRRAGTLMTLETKENPGNLNVLLGGKVVALESVPEEKKMEHWRWSMAKWLFRRGPVFGYIYSKVILRLLDMSKKDPGLCRAVFNKHKALYEQIRKFQNKDFVNRLLYGGEFSVFKNDKKANSFNYKEIFNEYGIENHCQYESSISEKYSQEEILSISNILNLKKFDNGRWKITSDTPKVIRDAETEGDNTLEIIYSDDQIVSFFKEGLNCHFCSGYTGIVYKNGKELKTHFPIKLKSEWGKKPEEIKFHKKGDKYYLSYKYIEHQNGVNEGNYRIFLLDTKNNEFKEIKVFENAFYEVKSGKECKGHKSMLSFNKIEGSFILDKDGFRCKVGNPKLDIEDVTGDSFSKKETFYLKD